MPISGELVEFNSGLETAPDTVNSDPYGEGWMVKIKLRDASELNDLMDAEGYKDLVG